MAQKKKSTAKKGQGPAPKNEAAIGPKPPPKKKEDKYRKAIVDLLDEIIKEPLTRRAIINKLEQALS